MNLNTPIWQLTTGEFLELLKQNETPRPQIIDTTKKEYVYGLAGIAKLFNVSKKTAGLLKKSGKLDGAWSQDGKTILVDAEKARELFGKKQTKQKV